MTDVGTAISKRLLVISVLPFCHIIGLPDLQCRNLERFFDRKTLKRYSCFLSHDFYLFLFYSHELFYILF
jgi:hypothetical protein